MFVKYHLLLAPALLLGLAGCAFTEDVADVAYTPTPAGALAGAGPIGTDVADGRTSNRLRISMKINGYGMDAASIRSSKPVPDIVREALQTEFTERGFSLSGKSPMVTVTIQKFYNSFSAGVFAGNATGDVELGVSVAGAGTAAFQQTYTGSSNATIMLANGSNAAKSVSAALQDAIRRMFADPAFVAAVTARPVS